MTASDSFPLENKGKTSVTRDFTYGLINTKDMTADPAAIVRRNLWSIVAGYFPDALIADRTALEGSHPNP